MRFERELETAEALQRSLLPDQLPILQDADLATRYVPAGVGLKVGGDWYDAVPLRDGRVMLVIGDVVGHGVRAAASMGKLRNVLQYSALDGLAPAAVLQRLNEYFCALAGRRHGDAARSPSTTRPVSASATRAPGTRPRCSGMPDGTVEMLEGGRSMPLCASDQAQFHEAERELPAGSMLVLYTDGLIERRGESLDIGLDRLVAALRRAPAGVEDVADALLRDFLADDCTGRRRRTAVRRRTRAGTDVAAPAAGRGPPALADAPRRHGVARTRRRVQDRETARSPSRSTRLPRTRSSTRTAWSMRTSWSRRTRTVTRSSSSCATSGSGARGGRRGTVAEASVSPGR